MPRKPTQKHPIRDLRAIIGEKQWSFAKTIGIKPGTLRKIENNDRKLTRKIATRVFAETGANTDHLLRGRLRDELGRGYTNDFYAKWRKRYVPASERTAKERTDAFAWWAEILLQAAFTKRRFWQVLATLNETLDECRSSFALGSLIDGILHDIKPRVTWNPALRTPAEVIEIEAERENAEKQYQSEYWRGVRWGKPTPRKSKLRAVALTRQKSKQSSSRRRSRRA